MQGRTSLLVNSNSAVFLFGLGAVKTKDVKSEEVKNDEIKSEKA